MSPRTRPWWYAVVLTALLSSVGYAGTRFVNLTERVTALEAHHEDDRERLDRIENKLDRLLHWALGK